MESYFDAILEGVTESIPTKYWFITIPIVVIFLGVLLY